MSYPYGPENYPTIEQLESASGFRDTFYTHLQRLEQELEKKHAQEAAKRPITINLTVNGTEQDPKELLRDAYNEAANLAYENSYPSEEERADIVGIAFVRALSDMGIDGPDSDLMRLFKDLFNILDDQVISKADKQMQQQWEESDR